VWRAADAEHMILCGLEPPRPWHRLGLADKSLIGSLVVFRLHADRLRLGFRFDGVVNALDLVQRIAMATYRHGAPLIYAAVHTDNASASHRHRHRLLQLE